MKIYSAHKKHALSRGTIGCVGEIATLNVTRGCGAACVFCHARCYTGAPPAGRLLLYQDLPVQLRRTLDNPRRKGRPRVVVLGTASDVFAGGPQVVQTTRDCLEILLRRGVGVSLTTRCAIPEPIVELLGAFAQQVQVTVPIVSLSEEYTTRWEAGTALPRVRLLLLQQLIRAGVSIAVRIEPLIPGVNDTTADIRRLLSALVALGLDRIQISFLHLRPGVADQLRREAPAGAARMVVGMFPSLQSGRPPTFDHLDARQTMASLKRIQRLGRERGLRISACRCQNPGLPGADCTVVPPHLPPPIIEEQSELFDDDSP